MATLLATYSAATPSLADGSDLSFLTATQTNPDPVPIADSPAALGTALTGTPDSAAIGYVVFRVRARYSVTGSGVVSDSTIHWELGADSGDEAITLGTSFADFQSAPMPMRPDGATWAWADVAALADVGITSLFTLAQGDSASIYLAEVAVDVYGAGGIEGDLLAGDAADELAMGDTTSDLAAGDTAQPMKTGDSTGDLTGGPDSQDMESAT